MVALKHNWKRYLEPFFPGNLSRGPSSQLYSILERTIHLNWLEPSEEGPLFYIVGNEDDKNPPPDIA